MRSILCVALDTHLSSSFHLSLSFSANEGETTVLLGESGAGKSTVLRLLAGLQHPQQGHISLDNTTYFDSEQKLIVPPQERPFGYVFQDYVLFPHLTVFENVAFGLRAQHLPRQLIRARVKDTLDRVHLADYDTRKPAQLSGGQQQRVAIARALALQPQLLLLDEPLAALDVQTRREVRQELQHILTELHITTVLVTHQYLEALLFGHSILVLDDGRIIQQGDQRDLLEYPRSSYVAELVGVNFFRGRIARYEADGTCIVQLQDSEYQPFEIFAALSEQGKEAAPDVGKEAYVVVNPRSVTLYPSSPDTSARNLFPGTITQILQMRSGGAQNRDGYVRVSIALEGLSSELPPLTAEITEASATRLQLQQQQHIYAAFKATEASAYV